jgi:hypothetical protein
MSSLTQCILNLLLQPPGKVLRLLCGHGDRRLAASRRPQDRPRPDGYALLTPKAAQRLKVIQPFVDAVDVD